MTTPPRISGAPVIVLFRNDLRLADNRALAASADSGDPVVPVFIVDDASGVRPAGAAKRWWLHHSLQSLCAGLARLGAPLLLRRGPQHEVVAELIARTGARTVFWNRRYEPPAVRADATLKAELRDRGIHAESFDGALLHEPSLVRTKGGSPYRVFTPFWRALATAPEPRDPVDAPSPLRGFDGDVTSDSLDDWKLPPSGPDWAGGLHEAWTPGETGARIRLTAFLEDAVAGYADGRDRPDLAATSGLSPHLAHGEITPFQIVAALRRIRPASVEVEAFRREIGWREFCAHLLFHNPDLAERNFDGGFNSFPWSDAKDHLPAWTRGLTGYPLVDAGMRQLWRTGWMHNRVRMVAASFLTKHLRIDWREGEKWFWDTLVDADAASNPANWQWVAGSGADAAPYFRIFNPVLQGEKFDPDGAYVRAHVPELAGMPARYIHRPWLAPAAELQRAGVVLGVTYPQPVVDHDAARRLALDAYGRTRR